MYMDKDHARDWIVRWVIKIKEKQSNFLLCLLELNIRLICCGFWVFENLCQRFSNYNIEKNFFLVSTKRIGRAFLWANVNAVSIHFIAVQINDDFSISSIPLLKHVFSAPLTWLFNWSTTKQIYWKTKMKSRDSTVSVWRQSIFIFLTSESRERFVCRKNGLIKFIWWNEWMLMK